MVLSKTIVILFCILATLASSMAENYHTERSTKVNKSSSMKKVEVGDTHVIKYSPSSGTELKEKKDDCKSYKPSPPIASHNDKNNSANYSPDGENYYTSRKDHDDDQDNDEHKHKHHKHKHHKHHKDQMDSCAPGAPTIPSAPIIPDAPSIPTSDCSTRDMLGLTFFLVAFVCFL